jgi:hypothetical protein
MWLTCFFGKRFLNVSVLRFSDPHLPTAIEKPGDTQEQTIRATTKEKQF